MEKYVKLSDVEAMIGDARLISDETESVGCLLDDIDLDKLLIADVETVKHAKWVPVTNAIHCDDEV